MTKAIIKMYNNYEIVLKQLNEYHISKNNTELVRKGKKITRVNTVVNPVVNTVVNTVVNPVVNPTKTKKVMITFNNEKKERNELFKCACGKELLWGGMNLHISTKTHIAKMERLQSIPMVEARPIEEPRREVINIPICTEIQQVKKVKKTFKIVKKPTQPYDYNQDMLDDHNNGTGVRTLDCSSIDLR